MKVNNTVIRYIQMLCNYHLHVVPHFCYFQVKFCLRSIFFPFPNPSSLATTICLHSVSVDLSCLEINWTLQYFLSAFFDSDLEVPPLCDMCQHFVPLNSWVIFHYRSVYASVWWEPFVLCPFRGYCKECRCEQVYNFLKNICL